MANEDCIPAIVEILRWLVIVVPIFLAVWRYGELRSYTQFVSGADTPAQYWGIVTAIILGISLAVYLPLKIFVRKYKKKKGIVTGLYWRPTVLTYIILSAAPSLIITVIAIKVKNHDDDVSTTSPLSTVTSCDPSQPAIVDWSTKVALQICVLGLTFTEWISKIEEEHLTYDLISAMAIDLFYAYDVMAFISMATNEPDVMTTEWFYVCFVFAFVSMFQYVPAPSTCITGCYGARARTNILVNLFCFDLPFGIIRFWTLIEFQFKVSGFNGDVMFLLKNVALIVFDVIQLVIIRDHRLHPLELPANVGSDLISQMAPEKRRLRCERSDVECSARSRDMWAIIRNRLVEVKKANRTTDATDRGEHENSAYVAESVNLDQNKRESVS